MWQRHPRGATRVPSGIDSLRRLQERVLNTSLHLVRRFFGFLSARPLRPSEQQWVHDQLRSAELRSLFFEQPAEDQRHALAMAQRVGTSPDRIEAALLHDVGKADLGMGAMARSLATLWGLTGLRAPQGWIDYRDHGERGAERLEESGACTLAVAFARSHPGPVPAGVSPDDWTTLSEADDHA